jgi:beta-lactamase regulating signal transducer with metallopeptidase domain
MSAADQLLNSAVIAALGWTLVHFLWQGCIIALVYWLICALAPRHGAALRYWTGLAAMLLSLLIMLLTFILCYAPEARFGLETVAASAVNPFLVLSGRLPDAWLLLESGIEPVLPWMVVLWVVGVAIVSIRTIRDWISVGKLLREGLVSTEVQLQVALESIKEKLGVQLAVRLLVSTRVVVPMVVGLLRPVILMPVSVMARLPQDQLEMILAHELGHIGRFDYAFNLLQLALETLLFYHPAVTWMSQRVRQEREHCCDDLVVRVCGRPATYARALANLEAMRSPAFVGAIPATGGNLLARIRLIIDRHSPARESRLTQFTLAAIAGLAVALCAQHGYTLSSELNRVAFSVQLQAADVKWKTNSRSREIWGEGISLYAQEQRKKQLAVLKV